MHQNVKKNGAEIVRNNTESNTCSLPGKSPTSYKTNKFCRVRLIERLLYLNQNKSYNKKKKRIIKKFQFIFSHVLEILPSQFFDFMLSTNVSCRDKIFRNIHLGFHEKFHFEI
jgi:hypothetical protein